MVPPTRGAWHAEHRPARGAPLADTFTNHFHPQIARAAVEVLEAAGCRVLVPAASLCCGRPLYDYGMLSLARRLLREVLDALRPLIVEGVPLVGLEPSCVAVFRDELVNLFPHDEDALRLSRQTFTLAEFLTGQVADYQSPRLERKAVVHGHCHHKAIMKFDAEEQLLEQLGLDYEVLPSGCCGMAGSFGFEAGEHYAVSVACGERVLLPAVRQADRDTLIVADGFSCREQIAQQTGRRALHTAQVLQLALREGAAGPAGHDASGRTAPMDTGAAPAGRRLAAVAGGGGLLAAGALAWRRLREEGH